MEKGLEQFFEDYLEKESIFSRKKALQSNYIPETLHHRDDQIQQIAQMMAPILKKDKPSNLFVYGKTGTGKTATIKHITKNLFNIAAGKQIPLKVCYVNCKLKKITDTEYRLLAHLSRELGKEIPSTGLPTDEVYKIFFSSLEQEPIMLLLVLDEIDWLVKKAGDEILYNLTRINAELEKSQITIIGVSNDLIFTELLDPRVKSSLSEEEILFAPYNAVQIQHILKQRADLSFKKGVLEAGVIEKCAAYAARDHGDARRAIDLLRVAGELAERQNKPKVTIDHIDNAEEKIEKDRIVDSVSSQPKQVQAILFSILHISGDSGSIFTGEVYNHYKDLCNSIALRPLTQRRVSDVIGELDMLGIITANIISKGRYGRTREITLSLNDQLAKDIQHILGTALEL